MTNTLYHFTSIIPNKSYSALAKRIVWPKCVAFTFFTDLNETVLCSRAPLPLHSGKWVTHTPWQKGGGVWVVLTGSQVANRRRSVGPGRSFAAPPRWASSPSNHPHRPSSRPAPSRSPRWWGGGLPGPEPLDKKSTQKLVGRTSRGQRARLEQQSRLYFMVLDSNCKKTLSNVTFRREKLL